MVELLNLELSLSSTSDPKLYPRIFGQLAKAADGQSYDEAVATPVDRIITLANFLAGVKWVQSGGTTLKLRP